MGLTAGNAAGYRSGVRNTGIEDILVLPAVTVVSLLPGPALRDGCTYVLGLRFALLQVVAASMVLTVAVAAIRLILDVAASLGVSCCGSDNRV